MQKQANNKKTISFRLDAEKVAELDELGKDRPVTAPFCSMRRWMPTLMCSAGSSRTSRKAFGKPTRGWGYPTKKSWPSGGGDCDDDTLDAACRARP